MEPDWHRSGTPRLLWVVLVASFLGFPHSVFAGGSSSDAFSHDPADEKVCRANLRLISEAIQEYRKQNKDGLPGKISDLMSDFIYDRKTLICPFVQRTGGLRHWAKKIRDPGFDPRTSYSYEFTLKEIESDFWRGLPKRTWREYKQGQMAKLGQLGPEVPIVRCHFHRPCLNLAFGGRIYGSGHDWENNYSNYVSGEDLVPARIFADPATQKKIEAHDFPPRDPHAPLRMLDLTRHYNGLLTDSWQGFPENHLAQLPSGLQEFGGVPFDVRGVIQLNGLEFTFPFPQKIEGIQVRQKLRRIHVLHASAFRTGSQTNVAAYVIHYADDQIREIPIIYGRQIADWWVDPKDPVELAEGKVAWTGQNEAAKAYGKSLRLYQFTWENPLPDLEVTSISFLSRLSYSAPFLIAITIDP